MTRLRVLAARSLVRHRAAIVGLAAVLGGFQIFVGIIAANLHREGLFVQLTSIVPAFILEALGGIRIASFSGLVAFGFFHPVVMLSLSIGAVYLASELAGDVEQGLVDLIAARPVPRYLLVTRSLVAMVLAVVGVVVLMISMSILAGAVVTPEDVAPPQPRVIGWLALNLAAVACCFGAAGLAAAAWATRRAAAAGSMALVTVFLYLLHFLATAWPNARAFDRLSPFHYYDAMPVLRGSGTPAQDILILLAATAVLSSIAYIQYSRRDL